MLILLAEKIFTKFLGAVNLMIKIYFTVDMV